MLGCSPKTYVSPTRFYGSQSVNRIEGRTNRLQWWRRKQKVNHHIIAPAMRLASLTASQNFQLLSFAVFMLQTAAHTIHAIHFYGRLLKWCVSSYQTASGLASDWEPCGCYPPGHVESGKKVAKIAGGRKGTEDRHVGHTGHILSMAISSDGKYLVRMPNLSCRATCDSRLLSVWFECSVSWWDSKGSIWYGLSMTL